MKKQFAFLFIFTALFLGIVTTVSAATSGAVTYSINHAVKAGDRLAITATFSAPLLDTPPVKITIFGGDDNGGASTMTKVDDTHYVYTHTVSGATSGNATVEFSNGIDIYGNAVIATPTSGGMYIVDNYINPFLKTGTVTAVGGTIVTGKWNSTNTSVDVTVPIDNDSTLVGGLLQLLAGVGGSSQYIGNNYTLQAGDINGNKILSITDAQLEGVDSFADNASVHFIAKITDSAGNTTTGTASATLLTVDQTIPTATVSYDKTTSTNSDVVATITPSESVIVTNNNGSFSHTFTTNGVFIFNFTDNAGNTNVATASVGNITTTPQAPATGPVAYWDFSEGSGNTVHDKIGSSNGTVYGASWSEGALGFNFNGSGNYVQIPNTPALNPTMAMTISMWVKPSATGYGIALNKESQYRLIAGDVSTTKLAGRFSTTGSSWSPIAGNTNLLINNWQHVALTFDGLSRKIYHNGNLDAETVGGGTIATNASVLYLGLYHPNYGYYYNGLLDDVKIYDRALSASELAQEYGNSRSVAVAPTAPVSCTSWTYSEWSSCSSSGTQTRSITSSSPSSCTGGSPVVSQSCTYVPSTVACTVNDWVCSGWNSCPASGSQSRACNKISNCQGGVVSPAISQNCTPSPQQATSTTPVVPTPTVPQTPSCTADTWSCDSWNACSISGVQNRSCRKTFDCSNVETAPPVTDQYCEAPNRPVQQVPQSSGEIPNLDTIIKSTVSLICPIDEKKGMLGSGTVIDTLGTILTNKHVIEGTLGCFVGFINDFNDEPYFGSRQIADIQKVSASDDIALLKLRNPQGKKLSFINITNGNGSPRLGSKVHIFGYPSDFGNSITYTSGDFSGTDGGYSKTSAVLEHGNSGGGAYIGDGNFIGIPTAVLRGEVNAMGYILPINTINAWLGNSVIASRGNSNNNFSRVSSLMETMDMRKLDTMELVIPGTESGKKIIEKAIQDSSVNKSVAQNQTTQASNASFTRTLAVGSQGADVVELQKILIGKGLLSGDATGFFGPLTRSAVSAYQQQNGIEAVGTVGPKTRALLVGNNAVQQNSSVSVDKKVEVSQANQAVQSSTVGVQFSRTLMEGSRGADVTALQQILISGGFLTGTTTGYFGQMTKAAVSAYQQKNGLEAVGVTGPKTRVLLNKGR